MSINNFSTKPYLQQKAEWPSTGRHILAHYDDTSIIVYQAYSPSIGHYAAQRGHFGGDWSVNRMSWIKPNFLWMMYRSGWGTKDNQEVTLAVRLKREFFERLLEHAVFSTFQADQYTTPEAWKHAVATSEVRLQWDPDHAPSGDPVERRAVQLGMRGQMLRQYAREAVLGIEDISEFVTEQRINAKPEKYGALLVPSERVYLPAKGEVREKLKLFSELQ